MATHSSKIALYMRGTEHHQVQENEECVICQDLLDNPEKHLLTRIFALLSGDSGSQVPSGGPPIDPNIASICRLINISYTHVAVKIKACGHVFGGSCLYTWLSAQQSCPMCRQELFPPATLDDEIRNLDIERGLVTVFPDIMQGILGHLPPEIDSAFQRCRAGLARVQEMLRNARDEEANGQGQHDDDADALDRENEDEGEENESEEDAQNESEIVGDEAVADVENETDRETAFDNENGPSLPSYDS